MISALPFKATGAIRRLQSAGVPVGYQRPRQPVKRRDPDPKRNKFDKLNRIMRMLQERDID